MNIEHQVAPLELAQRMKALGFPQDTIFAYSGDGLVVLNYFNHQWQDQAPRLPHPQLAAPTVAEMGEWLPVEIAISDPKRLLNLRSEKYGDHWEIRYIELDDEPLYSKHNIDGRTEAEARARLLIALAESGALDPKSLSAQRAPTC